MVQLHKELYENSHDIERNFYLFFQASVVRKAAIRDLNDIDLLAQEAREVDNTGTIASEDRFENYRRIEQEKQAKRKAAAEQGLCKNIRIVLYNGNRILFKLPLLKKQVN